MSISTHQKQIDDLVQPYAVPYWSLHENLARLVEEVGELARLINHLEGPKPKKATEAKQEFPGELGDILFTVICIANSQNVDLDDALSKTLEKARTRDKDRFEKKS